MYHLRSRKKYEKAFINRKKKILKEPSQKVSLFLMIFAHCKSQKDLCDTLCVQKCHIFIAHLKVKSINENKGIFIQKSFSSTLISLIAKEVVINVEGVQKLQNQ